MERYETPSNIAKVLADYASNKDVYILDPSVGYGALLAPLLCDKAITNRHFVAIDIDPEAIKYTTQKFCGASKSKIKAITSDFTVWAKVYLHDKSYIPFDCIIMNPPFASRPEKWLPTRQFTSSFPSNIIPANAPIEAHFVLWALELLKSGGKLLSILPASLVASPKLTWFRQYLLKYGSIKVVHELPRFTFSKIEGHIYLVVFEKLNSINSINLLTHELRKPNNIAMRSSLLDKTKRLDYGFYAASSKIKQVYSNTKLGWTQLNQVANCFRGTEATPTNHKYVVHTTNYNVVFWASEYALSLINTDQRRISFHDILVKRVGRKCSQSFGLGISLVGFVPSDCVVLIRPKSKLSQIAILFALRVFMASKFGAAIIEKGSGAAYISINDLRTLQIPLKVSVLYKKHFKIYCRAASQGNSQTMLLTERQVSDLIFGCDTCE